jgi:hypothetical protein
MRFYYDRDRERGRDCVAQNVGRRTSLEVVRAILSSDRRLAPLCAATDFGPSCKHYSIALPSTDAANSS